MNLNDIHGYAGYVRDRETDSYYANARQYLTQIHRFMEKDKLRVDSLNRYLYVVNNPVNLVDPSGLEIAKIKIKNSSLEMIVDTDNQDSVIKMLNFYINAYEYDDRFSLLGNNLWGSKGIKAYNYAKEQIKIINYSKGMTIANILKDTEIKKGNGNNKDDVKYCVSNENGDLTYTITAHNFEKNSYQKMLKSMYYRDGKRLSSEKAIERMMRDMNAYNDLNSINDTDFKQIGINFSKHVLYGPVTTEVNFFRNKLNRVLKELQTLIKNNINSIYKLNTGEERDKIIKRLLNESGIQWKKVSEEHSKLHNYGI